MSANEDWRQGWRRELMRTIIFGGTQKKNMGGLMIRWPRSGATFFRRT